MCSFLIEREGVFSPRSHLLTSPLLSCLLSPRKVAEETAAGDGGRGILVAVLREDTGQLLLWRRFDTYLSGADKRTFEGLIGGWERRLPHTK